MASLEQRIIALERHQNIEGSLDDVLHSIEFGLTPAERARLDNFDWSPAFRSLQNLSDDGKSNLIIDSR